MRLHHWWWDGQLDDPVDWFEDPRDVPESPSFERRVEEYEPRVDCRFDEEREDRVVRGREV